MTPEERARQLFMFWYQTWGRDSAEQEMLVPLSDGSWNLLVDGFRAAVAEERERCAKIADESARVQGTLAEGADGDEFTKAIRGEVVAMTIALAIRANESDNEEGTK